MAAKKGGLEDVIAVTSAITMVDGTKGRLFFRGIDFHDLVADSTFEETAYLLWYGRLPTRNELSELEGAMAAKRSLPGDYQREILTVTTGVDPMDSLRTAVSGFSKYDEGAHGPHPEGDQDRAIALAARMPTFVAAHNRSLQKKSPVAPRPDLKTASNFLYMLNDQVPSERHAWILDRCLIIHADHELNASTFAARVTASTLANIYSAVTSGVGALQGPLHGGANEAAMRMLLSISDPVNTEQYILRMLSEGKKVPGFGHRVYKTGDPRAIELKKLSAELARETGDTRWIQMSEKAEEVMMRETGLYPNADFYSATVYYQLGIPIDLFTPIFACSRIVGWTANILEQYADNRLIRPRSEYTGPMSVPYVPIEDRSVGKAA